MSVLSRQFLYASTPLSFAMLVGFANRRRIESVQDQKQMTAQAELKQRIAKDIEGLNQHLQTLPSPEMIGDVRKSILRHNREEMKRLAAQVNEMQKDVVNHLKLLEGQNLGAVRDDIRNLENSYSELYSGLTNLRAHINQLANSGRVDEVEKAIAQISTESKQLQTTLQSMSDQTKPSLSYLQEQVNYLSRQMKSLPPPVDATSIKRELAELVNVVAELVPKRDLNSVVSDVRTLQQQQESNTQADTLLKRQIQDIQQRLQAIPDVPQFRAQIEEMLERELRAINQQLRTLPSTAQFQSQMRTTLQQELDHLNRQLQAQPHRPYELIFDLHSETGKRGAIAGSRQALEAALDATQQRLILICPWSSRSGFDGTVATKLEALLKRNCRLDVGWCHLSNPQANRYLSAINRRWAINPLGHESLQTTLKLLLNLKRRYPQRFRFKVLGTVENFLVSDNRLAVLGIENRLKVATQFDDLELKLRTTDPAVIRQLTQRFDHPTPASDDVEAFWNRAITQYDLGDRASSLADLDRIIAVTPNDAAAFNMRGVIRYDRQDTTGAIADFSRAIEINPNRGDAFCNRGLIHSELGDQYGAIADFSLAIEADPTSAIAYFYRGLACQKLHDHDGAISDYSHALQHAPDAAVVLYYRGVAYQAVQNYDGAIADLEQAASLFRDAGKQGNVRRAMRQLALAMEQAANAELAELPDTEAETDAGDSADTAPKIVSEKQSGLASTADAADIPSQAADWYSPPAVSTNGGSHAPAEVESDTLASFFADAPEPLSSPISTDREEEPFLEFDDRTEAAGNEPPEAAAEQGAPPNSALPTADEVDQPIRATDDPSSHEASPDEDLSIQSFFADFSYAPAEEATATIRQVVPAAPDEAAAVPAPPPTAEVDAATDADNASIAALAVDLGDAPATDEPDEEPWAENWDDILAAIESESEQSDFDDAAETEAEETEPVPEAAVAPGDDANAAVVEAVAEPPVDGAADPAADDAGSTEDDYFGNAADPEAVAEAEEFLAPSYVESLGSETGTDTIPIDAPAEDHPIYSLGSNSNGDGGDRPPVSPEPEAVASAVPPSESRVAIATDNSEQNPEQLGTQTLIDFFDVINAESASDSASASASELPLEDDAASADDGLPDRPSNDTLENLRLQLGNAPDDDAPPDNLGDLFMGAPPRTDGPVTGLPLREVEESREAATDQTPSAKLSFSMPPSVPQGRSPEANPPDTESFSEFCRRFSL